MNYYKAIIRYDGTLFYGWQKQPNQRTVQGEIEKVLSKLTNDGNFQVIGSGRTDTGVHALGQVVRIAISNNMEAVGLQRSLNSLLSDEIFIISVEKSTDTFQPVFDASRKTYKYYFSTSDNLLPNFRNLITYINGKGFDLSRASEACKYFVGEHDFSNYQTVGTPVKTSVREVYDCSVSKVSATDGNMMWPDDTYVLTITGNGFLKQMVRLIVSAVWSCAKSKITQEQITSSLERPAIEKLAPTAPPQGLYLAEVSY